MRKFVLDRPHLFTSNDDQKTIRLVGGSGAWRPVASVPSPSPGLAPGASAAGGARSWQQAIPGGGSATAVLVDELEGAGACAWRLVQLAEGTLVALDAEGVNLSATGQLCTLQVCFDDGRGLECFVFDVLQLGSAFSDLLKAFLENSGVIKLIHDLKMDVSALYHQHGIQLAGALDTQLAHEAITGDMFGGLGKVLDLCGQAEHSSKGDVHGMMDRNPDLWRLRPLPKALLSYAAEDVCLLYAAAPRLRELLDELPRETFPEAGHGFEGVLRASALRAEQAMQHDKWRSVAFDRSRGCRLVSRELLEQRAGQDASAQSAALEVQDDVQSLLQLIPEAFRAHLGHGNLLQGLPPVSKLRDVVLDLGTRPRAFFGDQKLVFLCDDPTVMVTQADIDKAVQLLEGKFGPDNRAGIDGSLHRISAMRWKTGDIYGLTLRAGRAVYGNTNMISDLLLAKDGASLRSILVLGNPGCGKTTIIREAARILSLADYSVVVVDTSNEICGDGMIVHRSVGLARRMVVPDIGRQSAVLIEAVQNHTPDTIIVDEIGRREEVEAARTVKARGVRLVGSAHGNLPGLVKNNMLNGLVGGVETVLIGDAEAKRQQQHRGGEPSKVRTQRAGAPVFDAIVELQPGRFDEWRIVADVPRAVDAILQGRGYLCQRRKRDRETGAVYLSLEKSDGSWRDE